MSSALPSRRRLAAALLLVAACLGIGLCDVSLHFVRERHRLVTRDIPPDAGGAIARAIPVAGQPLSVVVVRAVAANDTVLELRLDGRLAGQARLRAGAEERLDFQLVGAMRPGGLLEIRSSAGSWTLRYLELANVHGFSWGVFEFNIVPAGRRDYRSLPPWLLLAMAPALLALGLVGPAPSRAVRNVERALLVLGLAPIALAAAAPLVSRFAVVLEFQTWLQSVALIFGGPALRAIQAARHSRRASLVQATSVVLLAAAFFISVTLHEVRVSQGDYSRFLFLGENFASAPVLDWHPGLRESLRVYPSGYDGQFMYLMAFDPFLSGLDAGRYREVVDSPAYRFGRIGFSVLTRLFSGGDPARYPPTMIWLIVAGLAAGATFLVLLARQAQAPAWFALLYVLVPGFMLSLARALPEPVAAALMLAGLWAYRDSRRALAVVCWAAALLVRETGVVLIVVLVAWEWRAARPQARRFWSWTRARARAVSLLLALVPVAAWRLYVGWRLHTDLGMLAFFDDPHDLTVPFLGFLDLWSVNDAAHGFGQAYNIYYPVLLTGLLILAGWILAVRRGPVAAAAVAYGLLAVSLNFEQIWRWVGNGERGTFEAFVVLLVAALPFSDLPRPLRWALVAFAAATCIYDFHYATHSEWYRAAVAGFIGGTAS